MRNKLVYVIVAASILMGFATFTRGHEWGDDFASYIMQAKSIGDGDTQGFIERNSYTIYESSTTIGPVAYPWGYPLILVPLYELKGLSPLALKLPSLVFYTGFLFTLYLLTKPRFTRVESLLIVSLFAFNPVLIQYNDYILSDIPFLFFSTLALLFFIDKTSQQPDNVIWISIAIAAAFFIRTQGILLLASYICAKSIDWLLHRTNKVAAIKNFKDSLLVTSGFGILWAIYALIFPGGSESYFSQLTNFKVGTSLEFIGLYFQAFGSFFGEGTAWKFIYYILIVFFLIGTWTRRRKESVFIIYFVLWISLLIIWPYWQGLRFIFPLLPVFIYFTFWGIKTVIAKIPEEYRKSGEVAFNAFWLIIVVFFFYSSTARAYVNLKDGRSINGPFDAFSEEMFNFIKEKTPSDSVIIFFKPRAMRLFTDRDSVMVLECARLSIGDYVSIHKKWENSQIMPEDIERCGVPLRPVFENRRFIVYRVLK